MKINLSSNYKSNEDLKTLANEVLDYLAKSSPSEVEVFFNFKELSYQRYFVKQIQGLIMSYPDNYLQILDEKKLNYRIEKQD